MRIFVTDLHRVQLTFSHSTPGAACTAAVLFTADKNWQMNRLFHSTAVIIQWKFKTRHMIPQLERLNSEEREHLLRTPVLLSVLASCSAKGINRDQKIDAIKLSHLKPFTADPLLVPFYKEVERTFEQDFESISKQYGQHNEANCDHLENEIKRTQPILKKLNRDYASKLMRSFEKYERHVKRAAHSVVEDFIFPVPIPGLNA